MLDNLYGIHSEALQLKARRMEVLSTNIANADTPGFKAKDIDFRAVLGWKLQTAGLLTTHALHRKSQNELASARTIPGSVPTQMLGCNYV